MAALKLLSVLLLAGLALAEDSDVVELTDDTFDSGMKGVDLALVEFFAPW